MSGHYNKSITLQMSLSGELACLSLGQACLLPPEALAGCPQCPPPPRRSGDVATLLDHGGRHCSLSDAHNSLDRQTAAPSQPQRLRGCRSWSEAGKWGLPSQPLVADTGAGTQEPSVDWMCVFWSRAHLVGYWTPRPRSASASGPQCLFQRHPEVQGHPPPTAP